MITFNFDVTSIDKNRLLEELIKIKNWFGAYDPSISILFISALIIWLGYKLYEMNFFFQVKENAPTQKTKDSYNTFPEKRKSKLEHLKEGETYYFLVKLAFGKHFEDTGDPRNVYKATVIKDLSNGIMHSFKIRVDKYLNGEPPNEYLVITDDNVLYVSERAWLPENWNWEFQHYILAFDFDEFKYLISDKIKREYLFGKKNITDSITSNSVSNEINSDDFVASSDSIRIHAPSPINESFTFYRTSNNQVGIEIHHSHQNGEEINDRYFIVKSLITERLAVILNEPVVI